MNKHSLVSVIIPLYNAEPFVEEAIHSVLAQTHENIEIIVIDDHSTDNSHQIVSKIKSDKIKLVKNKRKGASAARNYGFELSKGHYIQYLDADDILSPNKIDVQVKLLNQFKNSTTIASCGWVRFKNEYKHLAIKPQPINKSYSNPIHWLIDSWNGNGIGVIHSWLTPRNLIDKAGEWNESISTNDDGEFFCRVLLNSSEIVFESQTIVYYRSGNPHSISETTNSIISGTSMLKSYQLYGTHLKAHLNNIRLKKAIATNYLIFIYIHYNLFPDLVALAEKEFNKLNIGEMWPVGGEKFKIVSQVIGFKRTLNLRRKINLIFR